MNKITSLLCLAACLLLPAAAPLWAKAPRPDQDTQLAARLGEPTFVLLGQDSADQRWALGQRYSTIQVAQADPAPQAGSAEEEEDSFGDMDDEFEKEFQDNRIEANDPLEGYNRWMTDVNDFLYFWLLKPVAQGYRFVLPEGGRKGVLHFFHNWLYPVRAVNNAFQLKFKNVGTETVRFVTNTTVGVLGFWDPARSWFDLEPKEEDFGQTLGYWGAGPGPHIVLPFLGPSNARDTLALAPDWYFDPKSSPNSYIGDNDYMNQVQMEFFLLAWDKVNETSLRIGEYESIKKDAVDFYKFLRDGYEQIRIKEIKE